MPPIRWRRFIFVAAFHLACSNGANRVVRSTRSPVGTTRALPDALRWRIICKWADGQPKAQIARELLVSRRSVARVVTCFTTWGCVTSPLTGRRGRKRLLSPGQEQQVVDFVVANNTLYLDQIVSRVSDAYGVQFSVSALWELLHRNGITRKVVETAAKERCESQRIDFQLRISKYDPRMIVAVDESGYNENTLIRKYGWAPIGLRAIASVPFVRGQKYSILAAMDMKGYVAWRIQEGSIKGADFCDFLEKDLLPRIPTFSVILLDNASIHKDPRIRPLCERFGVFLEFLSPYSPDFDPIEHSFFHLKQLMRRYEDFVRTFPDAKDAINFMCTQITEAMARACFKGAGYRIDFDC